MSRDKDPEKRKLWFPMLMLCLGFLFAIAGIEEKVSGDGGYIGKNEQWISWQKSIAVGVILVAWALYTLLLTKKKEPNQSSEPTAPSGRGSP